MNLSHGMKQRSGLLLSATLVMGLAFSPNVMAQAPAIKKGGTLVVAITDNPPELNSGISNNILTGAVSGQIYELLVKLDKNLNVKASLAESWEVAPDGLSVTFKLRPNVKWHDGKPFTSADVAYSLLEINGKYNSVAVANFKVVERIDTPDPLTAILRLKAPDPAFFPSAFIDGARMLPKHIYEGSDPRTNPANFAPIGTGPFKFKEWVRGSHIVFERNPDYYDADKIYLDRLVYQVMPEASARQLALEKGDVDHLPYFSLAPSAVEILGKGKNTEVIDTTRPALGIIIMFFNTRNEPLNNKEVRQAIGYSIDRQLLIKLALSGRGKVPTGPIRTDNHPFYTPDVRIYKRDVAMANNMLDKAGFPRKAGGVRFAIRLAYEGTGEGGSLQSAAEIMREQLKDVGITVNLVPQDPAAWQETSFIRWDYDMTMGSFLTGPDPKAGVGRLYLTENIAKRNSANLMGYTNPAFDEVFKKGDVEIDPAKRAKYYQDAQKIIVDDLPALWLWEKTYPIALRKGLVGLPSGATHGEPFVDVGWVK
jgi:peptide/nickel transport system substrate-binding protein